MRSIFLLAAILCSSIASVANSQTPLKGTQPLEMEGDIASTMIDGVDLFLLRHLKASIEERAQHWDRDLSSEEAYADSVRANRQQLAHILGVRGERHPITELQYDATTNESALVGESDQVKIYAVRWPVLREMTGRGLLLVPKGDVVANVVAIPDADQLPEQIAGLADVSATSPFALQLAASGCRVLVPTLISRQEKPRNGRATLTNREYIYRSAFELGRHIIGYEIQKILAGIDWFSKRDDSADIPIGVIGYGEGGMLALYAAALDERIDTASVSGYFGSRQNIWNQPISRNVFGLLEQFGDAEIATLVTPRSLIIETCQGPEVKLAGNGGAPAVLMSPREATVKAEIARARDLLSGMPEEWPRIHTVASRSGQGTGGSPAALARFLSALSGSQLREVPTTLTDQRNHFDPAVRQQEQLEEMDRHNQWLLRESPFVRKEFMSQLDTSSLDKYRSTIERYREIFRHEVVGHFDIEPLPAKPRSRLVYDKPDWKGYEVVLDVFPDVFAYGVLLVPNDIQPGEERPVVVCQHGLEGRPRDTIEGDHRAYHDFAAKLAERGFVTFAPQNIYIFGDRFRTLQRKAYPLKKTLFSVMVPQHQQIVDWLGKLPFVDEDRIAFYGLSYGGKSAMRIPPLVSNYCLSICSADFNEWVRKNASTRHDFSYVWTGEYEIFEWDLGSTFNYAEMAALICPRPFMVERGHFDGVGKDEWVAFEFAKVRNLYQAQLGIGDRCEIEWFVGPHTINGEGTFKFLHRHLSWPEPVESNR